MAKKNNGRDFLFSDDCGFINGDDEGGESYQYSDGSGYYHGVDGSEGYIYSDGSGYYHGADGSDGYIYSDGSAYFHGADGTDACKYSDGSGYYHGADGSDGYKYSDGSGYFTDSTGSMISYDAESDDDENSSSSFGDTLGSIIRAGMAEEYKRKARQRAELRERAQVKRDIRHAWNRKHRKGIIFFILIFVCNRRRVKLCYAISLRLSVISDFRRTHRAI